MHILRPNPRPIVSPSFPWLLGLAALLTDCGTPPSAKAQSVVQTTWISTSRLPQSWSDGAQWSGGVSPNNDLTTGLAYDVTLPGVDPYVVAGPALDIDVTLRNLNLEAGATVFSSGHRLVVSGVTSVVGSYGGLFADDARIDLGTLSAYAPGTGTLQNGRYGLTSSVSNPAEIAFRGADVTTNNATVELSGPGANLRDQASGVDALRNLSINNGFLSVADGRNFTTVGDFTNNGSLYVDNTQVAIRTNGRDRPTRFVVTGTLINYDPATKTLRSGTYLVSGADYRAVGANVLQFTGADIRRNDASIIQLGGAIVDEAGNDALSHLTVNTGHLSTVADRAFTPDGGTFTNTGVLRPSASTLTIQGGYLQTGPGAQTHIGYANQGVSTLAVNGRADFTGGKLVLDQILGFDDGTASTLAVQGPLSVASGTGVYGSGALRYQGRASLGGIVSPGNLPIEDRPGAVGTVDVNTGQLFFEGGLTLENTSELQIKLGGVVATTGFDQLRQRDTAVGTGGILLRGGLLTLSLLGGFTPTEANSFTVVDADALAGTFGNVDAQGRVGVNDEAGDVVGSMQVFYDAKSVTLGDFQVVPEPGTTGLVLLAAGVMVAATVRKRRKAGGVTQRPLMAGRASLVLRKPPTEKS